MSEQPENPVTLEGICQAALDGRGPAYEKAEHDLLVCGPQCLDLLRKMAAQSPDPVARIMPDVLEPWLPAAAHEFPSALAYMDGMRRMAEGTPRGKPSPGSVAKDIAHLYGIGLGPILTLRAAKLEQEPLWRQLTALLYLRFNPAPMALPILARLTSVLEPGSAMDTVLSMFDAWPVAEVHAAMAAEARYWRGVAIMLYNPPMPPPGWKPPEGGEEQPPPPPPEE